MSILVSELFLYPRPYTRGKLPEALRLSVRCGSLYNLSVVFSCGLGASIVLFINSAIKKNVFYTNKIRMPIGIGFFLYAAITVALLRNIKLQAFFTEEEELWSDDEIEMDLSRIVMKDSKYPADFRSIHEKNVY